MLQILRLGVYHTAYRRAVMQQILRLAIAARSFFESLRGALVGFLHSSGHSLHSG